jgi:hypothetical protein
VVAKPVPYKLGHFETKLAFAEIIKKPPEEVPVRSRLLHWRRHRPSRHHHPEWSAASTSAGPTAAHAVRGIVSVALVPSRVYDNRICAGLGAHRAPAEAQRGWTQGGF